MPNHDHSRQLTAVTFRCGACKRTFSAVPARVDPLPEQDWHPWAYFAECADCGDEVQQAPFERGLLKAWQSATGPKTPEGKAASAANLEGHPTPEEALRTRFNAMKHGLSAKTATYFPARPDGYAFCKACEIDRDWCKSQAACQKRTELFMLHHAAFESRNPRHLAGVYADLQAAVLAIVQQIIQAIIADGVKIELPAYYTNKDGELIVAEYVDEAGQRRILLKDVVAHPLFKPLGELLSRNGLSLSDMGMTSKVIDEEEHEFGRLQAQDRAVEALSDYSQRQAKAIEDLRGVLERAGARRDADPILIEYNQQNGGAA